MLVPVRDPADGMVGEPSGYRDLQAAASKA